MRPRKWNARCQRTCAGLNTNNVGRAGLKHHTVKGAHNDRRSQQISQESWLSDCI